MRLRLENRQDFFDWLLVSHVAANHIAVWMSTWICTVYSRNIPANYPCQFLKRFTQEMTLSICIYVHVLWHVFWLKLFIINASLMLYFLLNVHWNFFVFCVWDFPIENFDGIKYGLEVPILLKPPRWNIKDPSALKVVSEFKIPHMILFHYFLGSIILRWICCH